MIRKIALALMLFSMGVFISPVAYADATDLFATGQDSSGNYLFRVTSDGSIYTASDITVTDDMAVVDVVATGDASVGDDLTVTDDINVGATTRIIDAGTGSINISTSIVVTGALGISYVGQTLYEVRIASSLPDTTKCSITGVSGKAGWGQVQVAGTACVAQFTFTTAGVVTLSSATANVTTTENNDGTLNVCDDGSNPAFDNELGSTLTVYGNIFYIN